MPMIQHADHLALRRKTRVWMLLSCIDREPNDHRRWREGEEGRMGEETREQGRQYQVLEATGDKHRRSRN